MPTETFANPPVKRVIFEARFPTLFYLESKIGELQLALMKDYPIAKLLHRQQFVFGQWGSGANPELLAKAKDQQDSGEKIWQFENADRTIEINVEMARFDITSTKHKTYNNPDGGPRFREVLEQVLTAFAKATSLIRFSRIGLRYQDTCPFPKADTALFKSYYNSAFPTDRFKLEETAAFDFATVVRKDGISLRYVESLKTIKGKQEYSLDFDASSEGVASDQCMGTTDKLHQAISDEFFRTIKDPVKVIMRQAPGGE